VWSPLTQPRPPPPPWCLCDAAGGVWGGAAAYVTVAVGFGMGVSYAALVRATAWTLARNHLDP
jgi:hypothetical protein